MKVVKTGKNTIYTENAVYAVSTGEEIRLNTVWSFEEKMTDYCEGDNWIAGVSHTGEVTVLEFEEN
jgi:hypothetical protein